MRLLRPPLQSPGQPEKAYASAHEKQGIETSTQEVSRSRERGEGIGVYLTRAAESLIF